MGQYDGGGGRIRAEKTELAFQKINHIGLVFILLKPPTNLLLHLLNLERHKYYSFAESSSGASLEHSPYEINNASRENMSNVYISRRY